jgi:hypothetical protein
MARSRGLGDVYKRQANSTASAEPMGRGRVKRFPKLSAGNCMKHQWQTPPAEMEGGVNKTWFVF